MQPTVTLDPRDAWAHARRIECYRYAKELGVTEITEDMPKDLMVKRLKALGHPAPSVPKRPIGKDMNPRSGDTDVNSHRYSPIVQSSRPAEKTVQIDADELLERQWKEQEAQLKAEVRPMEVEMGWNEMRAELKARGIKINRRWRTEDVKAILNGEQDFTKLRQ